MTTIDGVRLNRDGGILEVILDRPKVNAIDLTLSRRLNQVWTEFQRDPELRIGILAANGDKFFCPGWDLKGAAEGEPSDADWGVGGFGGLNHPRNLDKPIIAAVNGIACGGGFEMVLGCDLIVMEEQARFALPEINVGVLPDAAGIKLRRRIPYHIAVELLMTGRWMDATEAKHWGLCNYLVPKGQSLAKAREVAKMLADGPPLLFPAIKQLLKHTETLAEGPAFEMHDALGAVQKVLRSEDLVEGATAFAEKRKPVWKGR
jgi:crotonobetainyl-CoA hydratase